MWQGPLPLPAHLEHYAAVYRDAPEIIFRMAEKQSTHRQELESKNLHHSIMRAYAGLASALIVALAGLAASVVIAVYASSVAGTVLGAVDLVGLVGVFVYGTRQVQEDRRRKLQDGRSDSQGEQLRLM